MMEQKEDIVVTTDPLLPFFADAIEALEKLLEFVDGQERV